MIASEARPPDRHTTTFPPRPRCRHRGSSRPLRPGGRRRFGGGDGKAGGCGCARVGPRTPLTGQGATDPEHSGRPRWGWRCTPARGVARRRRRAARVASPAKWGTSHLKVGRSAIDALSTRRRRGINRGMRGRRRAAAATVGCSVRRVAAWRRPQRSHHAAAALASPPLGAVTHARFQDWRLAAHGACRPGGWR